MTTLLEQVKQVAAFADGDDPMAYWAQVVFHKGELWAQGPSGGALVKTPDLNIDIAVPAKKLLKALQAVGSDPKLTVESGNRLTIAGGGSTVHLAGLMAKDMPKLHRPEAGATWHLVSRLAQASRLSWCVTKDPTRKHLTGFHLRPDGHIEATDGHALVVYDLGAKDLPELLFATALLDGLEGDQWLAKCGGRVFISSEKGGASGFRVGALIDSVFPDTKLILSGQNAQGSMRVKREALIELLKRAKLSSVEVRLQVEGGRLICEVDGDRQQSLFGFASSVTFEPGEKAPAEGYIGFSLAFLLPLVAAATSTEVTIYLTPNKKDGGLDPLLLEDGPYTGVVMPYRLQ